LGQVVQVDALVAPVEELNVPEMQSATREVKCEEDCMNEVRSNEEGANWLNFRIRVS
jgi:hypothetical protein